MIFHQSIGFPSSFRRPVGTFNVVPSRHAASRALEKQFTIPDKISMNDFQIVEIEIVNNRVVKMVLRGTYDEYDDICLAVIPKGGVLFAKTAWLNHWQDTHKTLDTSKYGRP